MPGELKGTAPAASVALIAVFVGIVAWFNGVDFYHRHFFEPGAIVAADNAVRIVFVGILSWLIYVPGAAVAALTMSPSDRAALSAAERGVLGFGIGTGIWHVVMLILGVFGLYYRAVMIGLCLAVLVASARHFGSVAAAGWRGARQRVAVLRHGGEIAQTAGTAIVAIAAAWLLLLRGLYPGGGGDYYMHYFYYFLAVLDNHGLAPNDVWYHYYYSKGSGLAFLGMLLTDPEAPALTTYPCVLFAAIAMMTLIRRIAPGSLWPAAVAATYLLYYLIGRDHGNAEGEFQKDHEEVTALIVLFIWALCMERCAPPRPFRIMAASAASAAAIVTQAIGILLGLFAGLLSAWSLVRRRWSDMRHYGFVAAAIGVTVLAVFALSYAATGLISDQPLGLTLYFADIARLDRWGVIPQLVAVAWTRNNYEALESGFGWSAFKELAQFTRLGTLWPFLAGPAIAVVMLRIGDALAIKYKSQHDARATSLAGGIAARVGALLLFFAAVALAMGRGQSVSFARLSTFFIPLMALLGAAASIWVINRESVARHAIWMWIVLPAALLAGVLVKWQGVTDWRKQAPAEIADGWRFLSGQVSLAEAYGHAASPYAFGGINPGALAAARQLPPGTPIWSTNVDSYCMVPGCLIESVISFKMSGQLDDILGDDPELAKRRLQEVGLNYFLFMKDFRIIDLLPYGKLFAPDTIGRYLGIKWSDGSTFLLTWIGPDTKPIGPDFLEPYIRRRTEPDPLQWFKFDKLAPQIVALTPKLRQVTQWGGANKLLIWQ